MGLLAYLKTQFIVHLLIGFVFVGSGLVINFVQLCTLVLWPLNKQLYRRLNCRLAYSLWSRECCPRRARRGGGAGRQVGRDGLCARRSPCRAGALEVGNAPIVVTRRRGLAGDAHTGNGGAAQEWPADAPKDAQPRAPHWVEPYDVPTVEHLDPQRTRFCMV